METRGKLGQKGGAKVSGPSRHNAVVVQSLCPVLDHADQIRADIYPIELQFIRADSLDSILHTASHNNRRTNQKTAERHSDMRRRFPGIWGPLRPFLGWPPQRERAAQVLFRTRHVRLERGPAGGRPLPSPRFCCACWVGGGGFSCPFLRWPPARPTGSVRLRRPPQPPCTRQPHSQPPVTAFATPLETPPCLPPPSQVYPPPYPEHAGRAAERWRAIGVRLSCSPSQRSRPPVVVPAPRRMHLQGGGGGYPPPCRARRQRPSIVSLTASASLNGMCTRQRPPPTALATPSNRLPNRLGGRRRGPFPSTALPPTPTAPPTLPRSHEIRASGCGTRGHALGPCLLLLQCVCGLYSMAEAIRGREPLQFRSGHG